METLGYLLPWLNLAFPYCAFVDTSGTFLNYPDLIC